MKLRLGFVTNSSSTNYLVVWSGPREEMLEAIISDAFLAYFACDTVSVHNGKYMTAKELFTLIAKDIIDETRTRIISKEEIRREVKEGLSKVLKLVDPLFDSKDQKKLKNVRKKLDIALYKATSGLNADNVYYAESANAAWSEFCQLEFNNDSPTLLDVVMSDYNMNVNYEYGDNRLSIFRSGFDCPCRPHKGEIEE